MQSYQVELLEVRPVALNTMEFVFSRPQGFSFVAGQAVDLIIGDVTETLRMQDVRHCFSLLSAPHEQVLRIATRVRDSAYKQALLTMPLGSLLHIEPPFGNLALDDDQQRAVVMLAGGIGITPFMSMIQQACQQDSQQQMLLFYSNRSVKDAAYLDQLQQLEQQMPNFKLVATMTSMAATDHVWGGETGYFTARQIQQYCKDLSRPLYYVSGPPRLVESVYDLLEEAGVDDDDIRVESFTGYE